MKRIPKTIFIAFIFILVLGGVFAWNKKDAIASLVVNSWQGYKLTQGLVGYWSFDGKDVSWTQGTAFDRSGQANDGAISGMSTSTTPIAGKIGQAFNFDGVDDSVNIGMPSSLNIIGPMSLFSWVKTGPGFTGGSVVSQSSASFYGLFQLDINSGDTMNITWGNAIVHSSSVFVSENEWHQIGFVRSGSLGNWTDTIYLDGVPAETLTNIAIDPDAHGQEATAIGRSIGNGTFFKGTIDEVRIYNRPISGDEVKRLYQMGSSLKQNTSHRDELTDSLAGYWTFDGKDMNLSSSTAEVLDASGNGRNGNWQNHATTTTVGAVGQAITLDGVNDFVDIANSAAVANNLPNFTVSTWFKYNGTPSTFNPIINKSSQTGIGLSNTTGWGMAPQLSANYIIAWIQTNQPNYVGTISGPVNDGKWHQATMVVTNANTVTLYIDGSTDGTSDNSGGTIGSYSNTSNIRIGSDYDGDFFPGSVDDARVYTRALSAAEVKRLYLMSAPFKENASPRSELTSGLVGYWTFDGKDMDWSQRLNVKDSSGNSNTGSTTNMSTTTSPAVGKIGQGLNFDGVNDYVDVGADASLTNLGDETRSMWIYPRSLGGTNFGTVMASEGAAARWYIQMCNSDATECPGAASTFVFMSNGATGAQWEWYAPASTIKLNQWQLITITYTCGTTPTFYYNGSPITVTQSQAGPGNCITYDNGINQWIGNDRVGSSQFDGIIDDVRVYNRKLSAEEVKQLYFMGK